MYCCDEPYLSCAILQIILNSIILLVLSSAMPVMVRALGESPWRTFGLYMHVILYIHVLVVINQLYYVKFNQEPIWAPGFILSYNLGSWLYSCTCTCGIPMLVLVLRQSKGTVTSSYKTPPCCIPVLGCACTLCVTIYSQYQLAQTTQLHIPMSVHGHWQVWSTSDLTSGSIVCMPICNYMYLDTGHP